MKQVMACFPAVNEALPGLRVSFFPALRWEEKALLRRAATNDNMLV
jgi:hypothetical protein